jgi:hypothetical protein
MTVELDVFSGRPNPQWTLTKQETARVEELLRDLPSEPGASKESGLGFRGFILSDGKHRITVGGGFVRFEEGADKPDCRDAKGLEKYLRELANARGFGGLLSSF